MRHQNIIKYFRTRISSKNIHDQTPYNTVLSFSTSIFLWTSKHLTHLHKCVVDIQQAPSSICRKKDIQHIEKTTGYVQGERQLTCKFLSTRGITQNDPQRRAIPKTAKHENRDEHVRKSYSTSISKTQAPHEKHPQNRIPLDWSTGKKDHAYKGGGVQERRLTMAE